MEQQHRAHRQSITSRSHTQFQVNMPICIRNSPKFQFRSIENFRVAWSPTNRFFEPEIDIFVNMCWATLCTYLFHLAFGPNCHWTTRRFESLLNRKLEFNRKFSKSLMTYSCSIFTDRILTLNTINNSDIFEWTYSYKIDNNVFSWCFAVSDYYQRTFTPQRVRRNSQVIEG